MYFYLFLSLPVVKKNSKDKLIFWSQNFFNWIERLLILDHIDPAEIFPYNTKAEQDQACGE